MFLSGHVAFAYVFALGALEVVGGGSGVAVGVSCGLM